MNWYLDEGLKKCDVKTLIEIGGFDNNELAFSIAGNELLLECFDGFEDIKINKRNEYLLNFVASSFSKYLDKIKKQRFIRIKKGDKSKLLELDTRYSRSYQKKIRNRMNWLVYKYGNSSAVLLTLTIKPSNFNDDKLEMWRSIKKEFYRFMDALQKHFNRHGRDFPPYLASIQAQKNGNPHLHVVFFNATRLIDWRKIKDLWGLGFIYINRTHSGQKIRYPINYICRYITHTFTKTNDRNMLTQSLVWLFNVNSYSKSDSLGLHPLKSHKKSEWKAYYLVVAEDTLSLEAIVLFVSNFDHQFFRVKSPPII